MNTKRTSLIVLALAAALVLSSCVAGGAGRGSTWPGLAADSQAAYLSDGGQLFAVRLSDGTELWHFPAKPDAKTAFYANPTVLEDGRLVVGSAGTDNCLYIIDGARVDQATGAPAATCIFNASDRWVAAVLVDGNTAYAPNNNGSLYVLDLESGEAIGEPVKLGGQLWAQPVLHDGRLYVTSLDHNIYVVDAASRAVEKVSLNGSVSGSPAISAEGGMLYAGSFASEVVALDAESLAERWSQPTTGWVWGGPVLGEGLVYAADLEGQLYALDAEDGGTAWTLKPDGPITGSPLVSGENVIVTTESGSVYAFDAQGEPVWDVAIQGKLYTPAVQAGELILVAPLATDAEYFLTALNANGKVVWNFKPE